MTARLSSLAGVVALWALIYLPGLGSLEIKGEEGRRILPAIAMLEEGDWLAPEVAGKPYHRKPPLLNWLIAGSFELLGKRDEWAARLPSALAVLAAALALALAGRTIHAGGRPASGTLLALLFLTNISIIEKGRLAELEALYVALAGMAFALWGGAWLASKRGLALWVPAAIPLGLGLLTKGPLHLLFFYGLILPVLWFDGRERGRPWRAVLGGFLSPAHLVSVLVWAGIFACWAVPLLLRESGGEAGDVWGEQLAGRLRPEESFRWAAYLINLPRAVLNGLPWVLLIGWIYGRGSCQGIPRTAEERTAGSSRSTFSILHSPFSISPGSRGDALFRGWRAGLAATFLGVMLLPGAVPRYTLPLLVPFLWLLVLRMRWEGAEEGGFVARLRAREGATWMRLVGRWALVVGIGVVLYAIWLVPPLKRREDQRPVGERLNAAVPPGETIWAFDPGFEPFLFYVREPLRYAVRPGELPSGARWLLVEGGREKKAWRGMPEARWEKRLEIPDKNGKPLNLYRRAD